MSVRTQPQGISADSYEASYDDDRGYGWVTFAGVLLVILGTANIIEGIAAIGNAHFFVANTHYIAGSLNTWGWVVLCVGVIELVVGLGVFAKNQFSRWVGVVVLAANALAQLSDDAGVPVLVTVHHRARHPRDLRVGRLRQADRRLTDGRRRSEARRNGHVLRSEEKPTGRGRRIAPHRPCRTDGA